jgi:hypothetical protein
VGTVVAAVGRWEAADPSAELRIVGLRSGC